MTSRKKDESPKEQKRPRIQKEKLKDLGVKSPDSVKGGTTRAPQAAAGGGGEYC